LVPSSGWHQPRGVLTSTPRRAVPGLPEKPGQPGGKVDPDDPLGGLPAALPLGGLGAPPVQTAVSTGTLTKPNLEGRLFLAANFENAPGGGRKVETFQCVSSDGRQREFDSWCSRCG